MKPCPTNKHGVMFAMILRGGAWRSDGVKTDRVDKKDKALNSVLFTEVTNKHGLCNTCQSNVCVSSPEACVQSLLSTIHIAFTVCNEICNINHYYLSCDLDVDIEIEEPIYHRLI